MFLNFKIISWKKCKLLNNPHTMAKVFKKWGSQRISVSMTFSSLFLIGPRSDQFINKQKNIGLSYVSFCERSKLVGPLQSMRIPWWPCALQWKRLCFWRSSLKNFMIKGPDILWCSDRKLALLQFQMECWGMIWKMLLLYLYKAHCITKLQIFWLNAGGILPISFVTKIRDVRNLSRKVDFQVRRTFANKWG